MRKVTQRDIAETISGLRGISTDLAQASETAVPTGAPVGTVLLQASVLARHARYLEGVADELATLIPETPVKVSP
jgi:hypothetical protein